MSAAPRDREALDLVARRNFADATLVDVALEMQARRMVLRLYGALRPQTPGETFLATLTFFGTSALGVENESGAFPESVRLADLELSYSDADDQGSVEVKGRSSWSMFCSFDGLAYEEHPAMLASLRDELTDS